MAIGISKPRGLSAASNVQERDDCFGERFSVEGDRTVHFADCPISTTTARQKNCEQ